MINTLASENAAVAGRDAGTAVSNEKPRMLSLLYLALSRAEREIRVFVNEDDGGAAEVLLRVVAKGRMESEA